MALTQIIGSGIGNVTSEQQNAQSFRLTQDVSGTSSLQTFTPFEEADTDYTRVGSANWTVSSGIFSVATTGTYLCYYHCSINAASGGDEFDLAIQISTNSGGAYTTRARTYGFENGQKNSASNQLIFTVSNAGTFRLKMTTGEINGMASGSSMLGDTSMTETGITFVKLGVI